MNETVRNPKTAVGDILTRGPLPGSRKVHVGRVPFREVALSGGEAAGGLSECKKIADMAEAFGVRYNPHVWGTGIALAASLHLLAVLPPHTPTSLAPVEPILEFDRTEHPLRQAILKEPIEHKNGVVRVPDGSGLGIDIDRNALVRFATKA